MVMDTAATDGTSAEHQDSPGCAALFDLNGTLVDDADWSYEAWRQVAASRGRVLTAEEFRARLSGLAATETMGYLFGPGLLEAEAERLAEEKQRIYRELLRAGAIEVRGATQFLRSLAAFGVPLAVVTSARQAIADFLLDELGLRGLFRVVVGRALVALGKPAPDVYLLAASLLGVSPARCVVFEDSCDGVRGARAAGMKCVGLATSLPAELLGDAGADLVVPDFESLSVHSVLGLVSEEFVHLPVTDR